MRLLLVEDQRINQQLAVELLQETGASIDVAEHGEEALRKINAHEPDHYALVLMDLQMPVLDGYETTRRLRADPRYAELPVVALTAHVTTEERARCQALGMQAQIGKPIDPDDLYRVVAGFHSPEVSHVEPREERVERGTRSSPAAPNPPSDRLVAQLANVPGLDVGAGLASTAGRTGLYRGLLRSFVQQFEPFSHELNTLLMEGKLDDVPLQAFMYAGGIEMVREAANA